VIFTSKSCQESIENEEIKNSSDVVEDLVDKSKTFHMKMLTRRREEHLRLLKMIGENPKYEWRFKLVSTGVSKVFDLINENRIELKKPENDEETKTKAKMLVIENACLLMDFIVNFSDDIYTIFKRVEGDKAHQDWRAMLKLSFEFLKNDLELLDALTTKEYEFVMTNFEKIMNQEKLPDYPYENNIRRDIAMSERIYQHEQERLKHMNKKEKKKLKKGPTLQKQEL
jgi:hypothetical protein